MISVPALVLALTFGWAALAKVVRYDSWRTALGGYRLPEGLARVAAPGVPLAEAATAAALVAGGDTTRAGAALGVALVAAFSLAVLRARRPGDDRLPCGCFGGAGRRDYRLMLVRNAFLGAVAAVVLLVPRVAAFELDAPDASQMVPAALAALGLALLAWVLWAAARGVRR
ncbi:MAG: MauE/DoxX family redox-associated membrane protein [Actinomycetota bacterium]